MRVLTIFGTRPEAIKLAPVIRELQARPGIESRVCVTAQHRGMLDQVLVLFDLKPDHDLDLMQPRQTLGALTARLITGLDAVLERESPDLVLVQGDTTTTFAAALSAYYRKIPVGHVEAGLRTGDIYAPFPEEVNRQLVSRITAIHFAPTDLCRANLEREGLAASTIHVTGNTVIDALLWVTHRIKNEPELARVALAQLPPIDFQKRIVIVTAHRRESFGAPMRRICDAVARLSEREDVQLVFPVHCNPEVRKVVDERLAGCRNVFPTEPLDYLTFSYLMGRAYLLLSDSGGVQEEAPALSKPVLVLRDVTERREAIETGTVALVGTDSEQIVTKAIQLLDDEAAYRRMAVARNPYGDGTAAQRIAHVVSNMVL